MMEDNIRKGMCVYVCVCVYKWLNHFCLAEIGTTLQINQTLIFKKDFKNRNKQLNDKNKKK